MRIPIFGTNTSLHINVVMRQLPALNRGKMPVPAHTIRMLEAQVVDHSGNQPIVTSAAMAGLGRTRGDEPDGGLSPAHEAVLSEWCATQDKQEAEASSATPNSSESPEPEEVQSDEPEAPEPEASVDAEASTEPEVEAEPEAQSTESSSEPEEEPEQEDEPPEASTDYAEASDDDLELLKLSGII